MENPKNKTKQYPVEEWITITQEELTHIYLESEEYEIVLAKCPFEDHTTTIHNVTDEYFVLLSCGCDIPDFVEHKSIEVTLRRIRNCASCGAPLNYDDFVHTNLNSKLDLEFIWNAKTLHFNGREIPLGIECCNCFRDREDHKIPINSPELPVEEDYHRTIRDNEEE